MSAVRIRGWYAGSTGHLFLAAGFGTDRWIVPEWSRDGDDDGRSAQNLLRTDGGSRIR
jgi:hypothetical protein